MKIFFISIFCIFSLLFISFESVNANTSPLLTLESVSPRSDPDQVTLQCHDDIDLAQYMISDLDGTDSFLSDNNLNCSSDQLIHVIWDEGNTDISSTIWTLYISDTDFTNTKDQIVILDQDDNVIDGMVFWDGKSAFDSSSELSDIEKLTTNSIWNGTNSNQAVIIEEDETWYRISYNHQASDWSATNTNSNQGSNNTTNNSNNQNISYDASIIIKTVYPNPIGVDSEGEYIILENLEKNIVNISQWSIQDNKSNYTFTEGTTIAKLDTLKLPRSQTRFSLNNDNDIITLLNPNNKIIDTFSYDKTKEGIAYTRHDNTITEKIIEESADDENKNITIENDNQDTDVQTENSISSDTESDQSTEISTNSKFHVKNAPQGYLSTVYSPQNRWYIPIKKTVSEHPRIIITALQSDSENNKILFYNPAYVNQSLEDYQLVIGRKIQNINLDYIPPRAYQFYATELPNQNGSIQLIRHDEKQTISYESQNKNSWYILNQFTGLWEWSLEPFLQENAPYRFLHEEPVVTASILENTDKEIKDIETKPQIENLTKTETYIDIPQTTITAEKTQPSEYIYTNSQPISDNKNNNNWIVSICVLLCCGGLIFVMVKFIPKLLKHIPLEEMTKNSLEEKTQTS